MVERTRFSIPALAFHEAIIAPAFDELVPQEFPYKGTVSEFTLMDDVVSKRPIIDIRRHQNILQRRDASCDIIYKKVFNMSTRFVTTEETYAATAFCRNSFYQGDLKDFRNGDPVFEDKILPYFQRAFMTDIASNSYFGDVDRLLLPNAQWSTNVFDGVFKWIKKYRTANVIPASQSKAIANDVDFLNGSGPETAYLLIKSLYEAQPLLMKSWLPSEKAIYVSQEILEGYQIYLRTIGNAAGNITNYENGVTVTKYNGVELIVEPIWTPVITEIKGSAGYAAVLTIRGNFIFATDKSYGEGPEGNTALEVWYDQDDMQWKYRFFYKAGTQIALPEFIVFALSTFN